MELNKFWKWPNSIRVFIEQTIALLPHFISHVIKKQKQETNTKERDDKIDILH